MELSFRLVLLMLLAELCGVSQGYNILMSSSFNPSHLTMFEQLGRSLIKHGHTVTLIYPSRLTASESLAASGITLKPYKAEPEMDLKGLSQKMFDLALNPNFFGFVARMKDIETQLTQEAESLFKLPDFMEDLEKENFDYVVLDFLKPHFVIPYKLGVDWGLAATTCHLMAMGGFEPPGAVTATLTSFTENMSFRERFINLFVMLSIKVVFSGGHEWIAKHAPERPVVGFADIMANVSLCLKYRESVVEIAKSNPPNVISIGSIMIKDAKELPIDYKSFMDSAEDGVIYFSFGSHELTFPEDMNRKLLDVFSRVKQKVIWRDLYMDESSVPDHVKVVRWAPQVSILAHPACKLFITHGGGNSLNEAVYHGVPMVVLPIMADQYHNAGIITSKGYGVKVDLSELTSESLLRAIEEVLTGGFKDKVAAASAIFKDAPPGGDTAVYWIEHVIKHGAEHLRPRSTKMPFYQVMGLDVIGSFFFCIMSVIFLVVKVFKGFIKKTKTKIE